ncbi:uncharacterized protein I303_100630 [Kwoniella dejecticola CBS 10117]|uniref:Methyltransferase domain-containing protein n=1 Tax=Kwoniella dejecticola CBS 10117 TaxID=1296121 RepID=A0AAJ8KI44_9TREE
MQHNHGHPHAYKDRGPPTPSTTNKNPERQSSDGSRDSGSNSVLEPTHDHPSQAQRPGADTNGSTTVYERLGNINPRPYLPGLTASGSTTILLEPIHNHHPPMTEENGATVVFEPISNHHPPMRNASGGLIVFKPTAERSAPGVLGSGSGNVHEIDSERMSVSDAAPSSPTGTFSTFSMTSTMNDRVFRGDCSPLPSASTKLTPRRLAEDGGRRFQAQNDEQELERLECQHRAFKAVQGGINYFAPVHDNLKEGSKALDIGCGTGIWTIEMAQEFPHVEWIGTDLAPVQRDHELPDNLYFVQNDVTSGLPFPDNSFDFVHARLLVMGVRSWKAITDEVLRVLKPGGLFAMIECDFPWGLPGIPEDQWAERARGHCKFSDYLKMAVENRGYDHQAASKTIAALMRASGKAKDVTQRESCLPLWAWSADPNLRKGGEIMRADAEDIPNSVMIVILDSCDISESRYREIKAGYLADLGRPGAHTAVPIVHNWGWKYSM